MYVSRCSARRRSCYEKYGTNAVADPYMTLVGYFNSLRELGGMRRLRRGRRVGAAEPAAERARAGAPVATRCVEELTSRLSVRPTSRRCSTS